MLDFAPLDNPVWHALTTRHQSLALVNGLARRYPGDVSPLAALDSPSSQAFADLATLVEPDESVALFTIESVDVPNDWEVTKTQWIDQMACTGRVQTSDHPLLAMRENDVPEMLALTAATQPGPFLPG